MKTLQRFAVVLLFSLLFTACTTQSSNETFGEKVNDVQRKSDLQRIQKAIQDKEINTSTKITGVTTTPQKIASEELELCSQLVPEYLAVMPMDTAIASELDQPGYIEDCSNNYDSGYTIALSTDGKYILSAPLAQGSEKIQYNF